jgi:hypothetical protein
MEVLLVVLVAIIVIVILVLKYKKNKPNPPVPPVVPPVTPTPQWYYYYVAVYDSGCLQQGFAHIANRFNLDAYVNQFYYNNELNRVEQILGREQAEPSTSTITNYEFAGKLTCEDLVN